MKQALNWCARCLLSSRRQSALESFENAKQMREAVSQWEAF